MGVQGKFKQCMFWFVVVYLVGRLVMSGHIDWQLTPSPVDSLSCAFIVPPLAGAGPQESFGDGPGNR
jgi:hypothetical protein